MSTGCQRLEMRSPDATQDLCMRSVNVKPISGDVCKRNTQARRLFQSSEVPRTAAKNDV